MIVKLLTEHHLEFLSFKGGCTCSSESTLIKTPHCWKSHVTAHIKLCPYLTLRAYLSKRNIKLVTYQSSMDPLFLTEEGHPVARHVFMQPFKHILSRIGLDNTLYSGHSFKIGAASSWCAARLEDHLIKTLGRWSSDCYRTYIHTPKQVIRSAQRAPLTELQSALSYEAPVFSKHLFFK